MGDATYIEGFLDSFNPQAQEDEQRELILRQPEMKVDDGEVHPLGQLTVVSAKQIVRLDVWYLTPEAVAAMTEQPGGEQPSDGSQAGG